LNHKAKLFSDQKLKQHRNFHKVQNDKILFRIVNEIIHPTIIIM